MAAAHCPACGVHYARDPGSWCGDTGWYAGPSRPGMVPAPCMGHLEPCPGPACRLRAAPSVTSGRLIPEATARQYRADARR